MRILAIGDVVGEVGCSFLRTKLPRLKKEKNIDLVIANGENSDKYNGITPYSEEYLFSSGVDVITSGNHAFKSRESTLMIEGSEFLIRPANFPSSLTPGKGYCIVDLLHTQVCVINLMGTVYMESLDSPFKTIDRILRETEHIKIRLIDFHAEATAEKRAMGFYTDGRVSAIFGTHTHIQTADETILPKGTGYITDLGMTGAINSVLGITYESALYRMKYKLPCKFEQAGGDAKMDCMLMDIDEKTGKTVSLERLQIV